MAEEIDLDKCNFLKYRSPVTLTLTLYRVEVMLVRAYLVEVYPHTKLHRNRKKTFCGRTDVRTDGRTHLSSVSLLGHPQAMT